MEETKKCSSCKRHKERQEFNRNKSKKDGLHTFCRECQSKYYRGRYKRSGSGLSEKVKERKKRHKELLIGTANRIKAERGCKCCDEDTLECLQFHHIDPTQKEYAIAAIARRGYSMEKFLKEIGKCEVVCANCHIKVHVGLIGA